MADDLSYSSKRRPEPEPYPASLALDGIELAKQRAQEIARQLNDASKRPRVDNGSVAASVIAGDALPKTSVMSVPSISQASLASYGYGSSKKIDIPNARVGIVIGKSGETIKYIQNQSGAKIQVTRDAEADPNSLTRSVELMGNPEQISKAEQLITEVLSEAEAGGSSSLAGRKSDAPHVFPGAEQFQMKVPNNKVGLVIGKGGETIKSMQAKSGARIQVVPLFLPPGDTSTERSVYIDGSREQIEAAKQLVTEVINGNRIKDPMSGGYSQQGCGPPQSVTGWATQNTQAAYQQPGYGDSQHGSVPVQPLQYSSQGPYSGYAPSASGGYQAGWDSSSNVASQQAAPEGGYNYNSQPPQQLGGTTGTVDTAAYNYNYGQPHLYTSQTSYSNSGYSQPYGTQNAYLGDYPAPAPVAAPPPPQQGYSMPSYSHQQVYNSTQGAASSGYGIPSSQPAFASEPPVQPGNPAYPQPHAAQKFPPAYLPSIVPQPAYTQGHFPPPPSGYGQDSVPAAAPRYESGAPLVGYGPQQSGTPPSVQPVYSQQQQQPYVQPPAHSNNSVQPSSTPVPSVTKASLS